jgi:hypothetical protein
MAEVRVWNPSPTSYTPRSYFAKPAGQNSSGTTRRKNTMNKQDIQNAVNAALDAREAAAKKRTNPKRSNPKNPNGNGTNGAGAGSTAGNGNGNGITPDDIATAVTNALDARDAQRKNPVGDEVIDAIDDALTALDSGDEDEAYDILNGVYERYAGDDDDD